MVKVLVTGASGFVAKHIIRRLLAEGHEVRGSLRSPARADEVRAAVGADDAKAPGLSFVTLDLGRDEGWEAALAGTEALIHVASPFPVSQPKDPQALIRPAVDGTLRALRGARAAGVGRVVLTSSIVAIYNCAPPKDRSAYDERDWSDPAWPTSNAYSDSKTLAERAAWDFLAGEGQGIALTTINPGMVCGPPTDRNWGTSIGFIERLLAGKDPGLPRSGLPFVDVRDVAEAHVRAMTTPAAAGQRIAVAGDWLWFSEVAHLLKKVYPERRIATREMPNFLVRLAGMGSPAIRQLVPTLGVHRPISNSRARQVLGLELRPATEAILASAEAILKHAARR